MRARAMGSLATLLLLSLAVGVHVSASACAAEEPEGGEVDLEAVEGQADAVGATEPAATPVLATAHAPAVSGIDWQAEWRARVEGARVRGEPVTLDELLTAREAAEDPANPLHALVSAWRQEEPPDQSGTPLDVLYSRPDAMALGTRRSDPVLLSMSEWLDLNVERLQLALDVAAHPPSPYPLARPDDEFGEPFAMEYPHLSPLRQAAQLVTLRATHCAGVGEGGKAADDVVTVLRLGRHLTPPSNMIEVLCRTDIQRLALDALEQGLGLCELPRDRLPPLRHELTRERGAKPLVEGILSERVVCYYFATLPIARVRALLQIPEDYVDLLADAQRRARDVVYLFDVTTRAAHVAGMPARKALGELPDLERACEQPPEDCIISLMLMPAFGVTLRRALVIEAQLAVAAVALAVEEHRMATGRWPASLADLDVALLPDGANDPFADGSLRYVQGEEGVLIYSVGLDGEDDGGISRDEPEGRAGRRVATGWDIPFRLLAPRLRGARQLTFEQDAAASQRPALSIAAMIGDVGTVQRLLGEGADVHAVDHLGWTALYAAALAGRAEAVEALLRGGADPTSEDERGRTLLHLTAQRGHRAVVEALLEAGADVNATDLDGRTPTGLAVRAGHVELAELLREHGGVE